MSIETRNAVAPDSLDTFLKHSHEGFILRIAHDESIK